MLYLVSTPIGNLEDMTLRAIRVLKEAEIIVCEDTRQTIKLLRHFGVAVKQLISLYEENEIKRIPEIIDLLRLGKNLALVSDSGTPLISDPGYKLVRTALENKLKVQSVPGPTAAVSALTLSGLPPDKFLFLGFPPEKAAHQEKLLRNLASLIRIIEVTVIFYVSPYKIKRFLEVMLLVFADREIVVARELTKFYEEVWRGKISEALTYFSHPQGEFVVLFH